MLEHTHHLVPSILRSSLKREKLAEAIANMHFVVFPVWSAYPRLLENVAENPIQFKNDLRKMWAERTAKTEAELNQKRASLAILMPSVAMVFIAMVSWRMRKEHANEPL
jgi:hypothetical protein